LGELLDLGDPLDQPGGERRGHHTEQRDAGEHQRHGDEPPSAGDREPVAVADRRDGGGCPPQCVAEVVDRGAVPPALSVQNSQCTEHQHR